MLAKPLAARQNWGIAEKIRIGEIEVRATCRLGELLKESAKNGQRLKGRPKSVVGNDTLSLADLEITRDQSSIAMKAASVPRRQRNAYIAESVAARKMLTVTEPAGKDAHLHTSRPDAAKLLNVSPRSVAAAARVRQSGVPELGKAVAKGHADSTWPSIARPAERRGTPLPTRCQPIAARQGGEIGGNPGLTGAGVYRHTPPRRQLTTKKKPTYKPNRIASRPRVSMGVLLYVDPKHATRPGATLGAHSFQQKMRSAEPRFRRAPRRSGDYNSVSLPFFLEIAP